MGTRGGYSEGLEDVIEILCVAERGTRTRGLRSSDHLDTSFEGSPVVLNSSVH